MVNSEHGQYNNYDNCFPILKDYLFYLQTIKGRSIRTVQGYFVDLRTFFRFILQFKKQAAPNLPFDEISIAGINLDIIRDISLSDVYEFLHYISSERGNQPAARARKVSSIKSFFRYLTTKVNLLETNPILELEVPSLKKTLPKYLTLEQCLDLLKSVDGEFQERDFCILTLLLNCGMRLSELVGINLNDIHNNTVRLLGKGNKERIIYLNQACMDAIQMYNQYRAKHPPVPTHKNAFFLTRRGARIGARRVEQIVDEYLNKAGLGNLGFSVHKLRHTAATIMYQHGNVDIRVLQEILGHANLGTTEIYTHLSSRQMEQAAQSTPLAKVKPNQVRKPPAKKEKSSDSSLND